MTTDSFGERTPLPDNNQQEAASLMGLVYDRHTRALRQPRVQPRVFTYDDIGTGSYALLPEDAAGLAPLASVPTTGKLLAELGKRTDPSYYQGIGGAATKSSLFGYEDPPLTDEGLDAGRDRYQSLSILKLDNNYTENNFEHESILEDYQNGYDYTDSRTINKSAFEEPRQMHHTSPVPGSTVEQMKPKEITDMLLQRVKAAEGAGRALMTQASGFNGRRDLNPWDHT